MIPTPGSRVDRPRGLALIVLLNTGAGAILPPTPTVELPNAPKWTVPGAPLVSVLAVPLWTAPKVGG
jgi:hypothetical protein